MNPESVTGKCGAGTERVPGCGWIARFTRAISPEAGKETDVSEHAKEKKHIKNAASRRPDRNKRGETHHAAGFEREPIACSGREETHRAAFPESDDEGEDVAQNVGEFLEWEGCGCGCRRG